MSSHFQTKVVVVADRTHCSDAVHFHRAKNIHRNWKKVNALFTPVWVTFAGNYRASLFKTTAYTETEIKTVYLHLRFFLLLLFFE